MSGEKDKISGRIKQAAGDITDNDDLQDEGERQEIAGEAKDVIDKAEDKVTDAVDSVKDTLD